jgi:hypothetical protein
MRNGHIVQENVENFGSRLELIRNVGRYLCPLGQELIGIVTRHNSLGTFVHNAREDALIVIQSQMLVNPDQVGWIRLVQDTNCNGDHLKILTSSKSL